jgi:hypothetical protein
MLRSNPRLHPGLPYPTKGGRLLLAHAITKDGFVPGALLSIRSDGKSSDYHEEFTMNAPLFIRWFRELLDRLQPNTYHL